jgi:hypothetical protein
MNSRIQTCTKRNAISGVVNPGGIVYGRFLPAPGTQDGGRVSEKRGVVGLWLKAYRHL